MKHTTCVVQPKSNEVLKILGDFQGKWVRLPIIRKGVGKMAQADNAVDELVEWGLARFDPADPEYIKATNRGMYVYCLLTQ